MITPTYKEQFDKLTRAYISGEVDPQNCQSCFCGNLLNRTDGWFYARGVRGKNDGCKTRIQFSMQSIKVQSNGLYTMNEIYQLEKIFLDTYDEIRNGKDNNKKEDALFAAFEKTLDLLKQIHISKGEVIDEVPVFTKRNLQTA